MYCVYKNKSPKHTISVCKKLSKLRTKIKIVIRIKVKSYNIISLIIRSIENYKIIKDMLRKKLEQKKRDIFAKKKNASAGIKKTVKVLRRNMYRFSAMNGF